MRENHLRSAFVQVVTAVVLVGGTAAVVRAQPAKPAAPVPTTDVLPPAVRTLLEGTRPVQLPVLTAVPGQICTVGEMVTVVVGPRSKTLICVGVNLPPCAQAATQTENICSYSDAYCTQNGGTPLASSNVPTATVCSGPNARVCQVPRAVCNRYAGQPGTHWEAVTTGPY